VENPQSQNGFVNAFEVIMLSPFQGCAIENEYEYRVAGAEANIERLPINIPEHGISKALTVIAIRGLTEIVLGNAGLMANTYRYLDKKEAPNATGENRGDWGDGAL